MWLFFLGILALTAVSTEASIGCRDMDNRPVDWFIFYKLSKESYRDDYPSEHGYLYIYMDANNKEYWDHPDNAEMNGKMHSVAFTLNQYYKNMNNSQVFTMAFNNFQEGHQTHDLTDYGVGKGVLTFDNSTGFWLSHSIPAFPSLNSYSFEENEENEHAHMGLCVTFGYQSLKDIGKQLYMIHTAIYQFNLPAQFSKDFPILQQIVRGMYQQTPPYTNALVLRSLAGMRITAFAKAGPLGKDIYDEVIAPSMSTSLEVQSARNPVSPASNLHSTCNGIYKVLDASQVLCYSDEFVPTWQDHSKFVVPFNDSPGSPVLAPFVCVGDMDRQVEQLHRAGGALCLYDSDLWNVLGNMIRETHPCGK